jgi:hypothetical protein
MEYVSPNKRNIAVNVLFSNDKIVRVRLLRRTSNSIEAQGRLNIMISYGTINFEELEMKSTQEMCFILNINEVDVTPSRENVIWNTKTREAVKECLSQLRKR